jgi:hypothetical protein
MNFTMSLRSVFAVVVCLVFITMPATTFAAASLVISEVMYNPVGTDDKHEWIEVCNISSSSLDIANYKLYESSSNHGLTLKQGSSTLGANGCAIFVTDVATFLADNAGFSGTIFDVSFSLSNTGEPLVLRDANGADVDGVSYASTPGGNGDGATLHRSGTLFTAGNKSPGSESGLAATSSDTGSGTSATNTPADTTTPPTSVTTVFHTVTIEPPAQLFVRTAPKLGSATNAVVTFTAEAYNAKGVREEASFSWVAMVCARGC